MVIRSIAQRGRFLTATTTTGVTGIGEASPLAGRSPDPPGSASHAFAALAARTPFAAPSFAAIAELATITSAPAARFAIETALVDALARTAGVSFASILADHPAPSVPINALVDSPDAARRALALGIRTLKVKIDRDAHARLAAIRAAAPDAILRADANRAWPTHATLDQLRALVDLDLEYVEEPCPDTSSVARRSPIPLALDESLLDNPPLDGIAVLVLKPTILGGLARCLDLARAAHAAGADVVVTHAYEGPVALAACAELARALRCRRAVGLAPHAGVRIPQLQPAAIVAAPLPGLALSIP
jgi:L-alanine-DL-glutamate epimerase-like enolase superfamily enzyme